MKNKTLIIGAARSGVAAAILLLKKGQPVVLTDSRSEKLILAEFPELGPYVESLKSETLELLLGQQIEAERASEFSEIIVSPGIPLEIPILQEAKALNIPIHSEIELAYRNTESTIIAITGTNGKTTTTVLTGELFKNSEKKVYVTGNVGEPVCQHILESKPQDTFVIEVSSFQLETIETFRPKIAVITNLSPDHLNRHKTIENYYAAKARIFENQTDADYLILNADDAAVCEMGKRAKSQKYYFALDKKIEKGAYTLNGFLYLNDQGIDHQICAVKDIGIKGPHNLQNAMGALMIAYYSGIDIETIQTTLKKFRGVEHRQEFVRMVKGVEYINDSKGTNTNASITALKAMTKPVILIAGGYDKSEDYSDFVDNIKQKVKKLILVGATAPAIEKKAREKNYLAIENVPDYKTAVEVSAHCAAPGDVVLLSPACASWDMFDNYEIRGKIFKDLVWHLED